MYNLVAFKRRYIKTSTEQSKQSREATKVVFSRHIHRNDRSCWTVVSDILSIFRRQCIELTLCKQCILLAFCRQYIELTLCKQ